MSPRREPDLTLEAKLGSIIVHLEEGLSTTCNHFDWSVLDALTADPDVQEWLDGLRALALVPEKR